MKPAHKLLQQLKLKQLLSHVGHKLVWVVLAKDSLTGKHKTMSQTFCFFLPLPSHNQPDVLCSFHLAVSHTYTLKLLHSKADLQCSIISIISIISAVV